MSLKDTISKIDEVIQKPFTLRPKFYYWLFYALEFCWVVIGCYWIFTSRSILICVIFLVVFAILYHLGTLASRLRN